MSCLFAWHHLITAHHCRKENHEKCPHGDNSPPVPRAPLSILSHPRECGNGGHGRFPVNRSIPKKSLCLFCCSWRQTCLCPSSCLSMWFPPWECSDLNDSWCIILIGWCFLSPVGQRSVIKIVHTNRRLGCPMRAKKQQCSQSSRNSCFSPPEESSSEAQKVTMFCRWSGMVALYTAISQIWNTSTCPSYPEDFWSNKHKATPKLFSTRRCFVWSAFLASVAC